MCIECGIYYYDGIRKQSLTEATLGDEIGTCQNSDLDLIDDRLDFSPPHSFL